MSSQTTTKILSLLFLLIIAFGDEHANAQSIDACGALPYLGTTGPEICVSITQDNPTITPINFRVPLLPGLAMPTITTVPAGEYTVDTMAFGYVDSPAGMAIGMTGTVTREFAGNATLSITVLGIVRC